MKNGIILFLMSFTLATMAYSDDSLKKDLKDVGIEKEKSVEAKSNNEKQSEQQRRPVFHRTGTLEMRY